MNVDGGAPRRSRRRSTAASSDRLGLGRPLALRRPMTTKAGSARWRGSALDGAGPAARPTTLAGGGLDRPYTGGEFSVARNGTHRLHHRRRRRPDRRRGAGAAAGPQADRPQQRTSQPKALGGLRELAVTAPDGGNVPTWILLPPGYQPGSAIPTILEIHGGPATAYGPYFSTDYQLYAAAGYAVLFTNPRGSTSYGQAFTDAHREELSRPAIIDDLMAAVDAAVAAGIADPEQSVRHRRIGRRRADRLDHRQDRPLPRRGGAKAGDQHGSAMVLTADGAGLSSAPTGSARCRGRITRAYWARSPLEPGRQRQDPDPGRRRRRGLPHPGQRGRAILYRAPSSRACRPRWSRCPGVGHGITARPSNRRPRRRRSSPGSTNTGRARRRPPPPRQRQLEPVASKPFRRIVRPGYARSRRFCRGE